VDIEKKGAFDLMKSGTYFDGRWLVPSAACGAAASKPQRFAERLCFSKSDRYVDTPFNRANPTKFTCAYCDSTELGKTIPRLIYNAIDEKTAVTKWAGESMDLGMAIDGLLSRTPHRLA
jgi:hypothetical protein